MQDKELLQTQQRNTHVVNYFKGKIPFLNEVEIKKENSNIKVNAILFFRVEVEECFRLLTSSGGWLKRDTRRSTVCWRQ